MALLMNRNKDNEVVSQQDKVGLIEDIMKLFKSFKLDISTLFLTLQLLNRIIKALPDLAGTELS
jgi:hypothetical protein